MASDPRQGTAATVFSESDAAKGRHGNGLSGGPLGQKIFQRSPLGPS
jgi:hypothetical protein